MSLVHEQVPSLVAIINEYGNCTSDYAHSCILKKVNTCSPYFQYREFDKDLPYKVTNADYGCYSQVHEIDQVPSTLKSAKTEGQALEIAICMEEFQANNCSANAESRLNLEARAMKRLMDQLMLIKESKVFGQVFDPANYTAPISLAGAEFDAATGATDPLKFLRDKIHSGPSALRPNWMVLPRPVLNKLQMHPAFFGNGCCDVLLDESRLAALLGLRGICVSDAFIDTAALGLPSNLQPIVDNSILLFKRNDNFDSSDCPDATFAFEASFMENGQQFSMYRKFDDEMGLHGGYRYKAGYSSGFVYNFDLGCLITDVCV